MTIAEFAIGEYQKVKVKLKVTLHVACNYTVHTQCPLEFHIIYTRAIFGFVFCDIVECSAGCDTCIMSGPGLCDGPRCEDGYYISSNFLCISKLSSESQMATNVVV